MWFSPGIVLGALIVFVVYEATGTTSHWWLWIVAVVAAGLLDAVLGFTQKTRPSFKRETYYERDKK